MLFQQAVGSSASGTSNAINERIFRVARNSYTRTATITAASFVRGNPCVLATASASTNGYDITHPITAGANPANNLLIGVVAEYPDTTLSRTGVWNPEDAGLVQCYGVHTAAILRQETVSLAGGLILVPDTGSELITAVGPVSAAATSTAAHTELAGIGGLIVLMQSIASTSATATATGVVFIRCM